MTFSHLCVGLAGMASATAVWTVFLEWLFALGPWSPYAAYF